MAENEKQFAAWLDTTLRNRGLSQAELARQVGVADAQVSRWRRGQVVPTVRYLQQIADVMGVQRVTLDRLAGYPVVGYAESTVGSDPAVEAEIEELETRFGQTLRDKVPPQLWRAYAEACAALADGLSNQFRSVLEQAEALAAEEDHPHRDERNMGFRR